MAWELGSCGLSGVGVHQNVCQVHRVISRPATCMATKHRVVAGGGAGSRAALR
jgi:hypothetical protein